MKCPNLATMFRVMNFALDLRGNSLKPPMSEAEIQRTIEAFKQEWGERDFEAKLE